ncbi:LOW QUALITY PROTEIN: calpain-A-like [Rhipicephalus sanguineus]|uniref:LOW QUALITY PROTEIN: calpain-A-like n=1 Tax=Rhipicephalus sanguineus TaxID=34632 RepID=UPI001893F7E4|nr:LOW QUALITY PROTEIN: calpain-A-like [Rhipicephalus sanguineus]
MGLGVKIEDRRLSWNTWNTKAPIYKLGERGAGLKNRSGRIQDFHQLRKECLANGALFEDPEFPCKGSSVWGNKDPKFPVTWLRPPEMCNNPKLFVDGASRFDVVQGSVGNCWMVASAANLTLNDELFYRVVPDDQSFHEDYAGIFHFRIWKANRWIDVVIDDRLPTLDGSLIFMKSRSGNEFWSALLEKAYAKLHGSYEALSGGSACEAMEDFTGGLTESIDLKNPPKQLFVLMLKAYERSSLMSCSIPVGSIPEEKLASGLVAGHAYSITAVRLVYIERLKGRMPLIRLRNPWGDDTEWRGAWSDQSREWSLVSPEEREAIGLTFDADGEFWMSERDFMREFHFLEICNLGPDSLDQDVLTDTSKKKWEVSVFEGSWVRGATAGGCRNYLDTFWVNPQYFITLEDPDDDDAEQNCTLIVALMQKNRRAARTLGAGLFLTIGFALYKIDDPDNCPTPLDMAFFKYNPSAARSHTFINSREVTTRFNLPPGTYCVVPSTFEPNQTGEFLLRIFTEKKNISHEHDVPPAIVPPADNVRAKEEDPSSDRAQQLRALFAKIAGDDMEVNSYELQKILNMVFRKAVRRTVSKPPPPEQDCDWRQLLKCLDCFSSQSPRENGDDDEIRSEQFSLDVCRSMVALMDDDHSGKLGLDEFRALWIPIRTWKNVFTAFDKDGSGYLNTFELRAALNSAGYQVNQHILKALVLRYGNDDGNIAFEDFIGCAVKLRTMIEVFKEKDTRNIGSAVFTIDEWLENTMYA